MYIDRVVLVQYNYIITSLFTVIIPADFLQFSLNFFFIIFALVPFCMMSTSVMCCTYC